MIKGMTGFGSGQLSIEKIKGTSEIKSLNHRYLDISFFLPLGFSSLESKIREIVQKHIERGKVTVSVKITHKPHDIPDFNKEAIKKYLKHVQALKKEFGFADQLTLSDLIKLPGVVESKEIQLSPEFLWPAIEKSIVRAVAELNDMRKREGRSLCVDVADKLRRMLLEIKKIQKRAQEILKEKKGKLTNEEFSSFQKSNDVNEELSRLVHYIEEFKLLLKTDLSVGKKLDFIAQEMQRETNTIGSKLQDKIVSNAVIALKSKIEKIREQSQNIE